MNPNVNPACAQGKRDSRDSALRERFKKRVRLEVELTDAKQEACAHELKVDPSLISHWGGQNGCDMPAWRLVGWTNTYGPGLLEWLAEQCGGVYQHGQAPQRLEGSLLVLVGMLANQSGRSVQELLQSHRDRDWTAAEKAADLPGLRKLQIVIETLIREAEGGGR